MTSDAHPSSLNPQPSSDKGSLLLPIEKVAGGYCALTCLLMLVMGSRLVNPTGMIVLRIQWLVVTAALVGLYYLFTRFRPASQALQSVFALLRTCAQLAWLILWYPDTYEFNRTFSNLDHFFARADFQLFGCQPSLEFYRLLPGHLWSEAFNLGYWSYYPMIALLVITFFFFGSSARQQQEPRIVPADGRSPFSLVSATILASFFIFYIIFIFLPVAGPQYYFQAVGINEIMNGHFPALGTYFSSHTEAMTLAGYDDGFFYQLVASAQDAGERPTAAFPSSHVGVSTIVLLLARRHCPKLLWLFLPLWVLLCCATVYIRAHYFVDAIAGLLVAPLVLVIATKLTRLLAMRS